jgi:hypothetical protein
VAQVTVRDLVRKVGAAVAAVGCEASRSRWVCVMDPACGPLAESVNQT